MVDAEHVRDEIYPLLRYDLDNHTKVVSIEQWVDAILGVSPETLSQWTGLLRQKAILVDDIIEENMGLYRDKTCEPDRYLPWSIIANRIRDIARDYISDLPDYKLPDLLFVRNDPTPVKGDRAHCPVRKPDVIISLEKTVRNASGHTATRTPNLLVEGIAATDGINWNEIIGCVEFKEGRTDKAFETWAANVRALTTKTKKTTKRRSPRSKVRWTSIEVSIFWVAHRNWSQVKGPPLTEDTRQAHSSPLAPLISPLTQSSTGVKRKGEMSSVPASKRLKTGEVGSSRGPAKVKEVPRNARAQTASYALELLANTPGTRSHCLAMIVDGSNLTLWYYDAGGIICSKPIPWITEFEKFAAIIIAFSSLDLGEWGIGRIPNLTPPEGDPVFPLPSLEGYSLSMELPTKDEEQSGSRKVNVTLGKPVFIQYSLVGRRTAVYKIENLPDITTDSLVLKMSMQATCRIPEYELLNEARRKGVRNLPEASTLR